MLELITAGVPERLDADNDRGLGTRSRLGSLPSFDPPDQEPEPPRFADVLALMRAFDAADHLCAMNEEYLRDSRGRRAELERLVLDVMDAEGVDALGCESGAFLRVAREGGRAAVRRLPFIRSARTCALPPHLADVPRDPPAPSTAGA